jgi:hypothetical protein
MIKQRARFFFAARKNGVGVRMASAKRKLCLAEIRRNAFGMCGKSTFDTLDTERKKHGRHARQRDRGLAPLLFRKA